MSLKLENSNWRGSVTAPAGHGKTHEIVELVKSLSDKPALILTHTNAGVYALRTRLAGKGIHRSAYGLTTLDAFCQRLVRAFPRRSELVLDASNITAYPQIRVAALKALKAGVLDAVLPASYCGVLIDEYQDCDPLQHELVCRLNDSIPVRVFGDDMQAIFDFDGSLVVWSDVERAFPPLEPLTVPQRWKRLGCDKLGDWLAEIRKSLRNGQSIDLASGPKEHVSRMPYSGKTFEDEKAALAAVRTSPDHRLFIIENSATGAVRREFARRHHGVIVAERADLPDLQDFATDICQASGTQALKIALEHAESMMTAVDASNFGKRVDSIRGGRARNPASKLEQIAIDLANSPSPAGLKTLFQELKQKGRTFRPELCDGTLEILSAAEFGDIAARTESVRNRRRFTARAPYQKTIGSTLLLKGLESNSALILEGSNLPPRHLYVALTRATHQVLILSDNVISR
jgi:AAA domain